MSKKKSKDSKSGLSDLEYKSIKQLIDSMSSNNNHGSFDVEHPYVKNHPTLLVDTIKPVTYHLYISLMRSPVKIFRRITVPSNLRLEFLAEIIIRAMGWSNEHLHQIYADHHVFSPIDPNSDWDLLYFGNIDSTSVTIGDVLKDKGKFIKLEYDLGDSWIHQVRLSTIDDKPTTDITVDSGSGACPPEDIGGVYGYAEMLEEGDIDADLFDLERARNRVNGYVETVLENEEPYNEEDKKKESKTVSKPQAPVPHTKIIRMLPYTFTVDSIRNLHPLSLPHSPTDQEYALLANRLERALLTEELDELANPAAMKAIISRIIMYYEDIVADAGMWRAFVAKNQELYGRPYPFYPVDDEFYVDEPDFNAVRLLVWDAFRDFRGPDRVINPENPAIKMIAQILYDILDSEFENTAINEQLADYFRKATFANDFYEMRDVLKWIFFHCYITSDCHAEDIVSGIKQKFEQYLYVDDSYYWAECIVPMQIQVGMLALLPKDWLAQFISEVGDKQVAKKIADIETPGYIDVVSVTAYDKHTVSFTDEDHRNIVIERGERFDISDEAIKEDGIYVGSYAKYDGKWYLNGCHAVYPKTSHKEDKPEEPSLQGIDKEHYDRLMEMSGGSPLFYFKSIRQLRKFLKEQAGWSNISLRAFKNYQGEQNFALYIPGVNKPIAVIPQIAISIKDSRNPCYNANNNANMGLSVVVNDEVAPGEVARYLIAHHMLPDAHLNSLKGKEHGRQLLQDNIDFFARAYRRESYL
jgi:hypothetical protein